MVRRSDDGFTEIAFQFFFVIDDFHSPAAEDVRRADDEREFQFLGNLHGFFIAGSDAAVRTGNVQFGQDFVEAFAVFGAVHAVSGLLLTMMLFMPALRRAQAEWTEQ